MNTNKPSLFINKSPVYIQSDQIEHQLYSSKLKDQNDNRQLNHLNQKIELLEFQNKEMSEREQKLKQMNEQIVNAFDVMNKENIEQAKKRFIKENQIIIQQLENENENIKLKLKKMEEQSIIQKEKFEVQCQDLESEIFYLKDQNRNQENEFMNNINMLVEENQRKGSLLKFQEEKQKNIEQQQKEDKNKKINDLLNEIDILKQEFQKQIQDFSKETEQNILNIRQMHEHEKNMLQIKYNGILNEKDVLLKINQQQYLLCEELKHQHIQEKDALINDLNILKKQFHEKEKYTQSLEAKSAYYSTIQEQNDKILQIKQDFHQEDKKKLKIKINELNQDIQKRDHYERELQIALLEKERFIQDQKLETKKSIQNERKKSDSVLQAANKIKEDYNKRNAVVIQEILYKEDIITKLQHQMNQQKISQKNQHLEHQLSINNISKQMKQNSIHYQTDSILNSPICNQDIFQFTPQYQNEKILINSNTGQNNQEKNSNIPIFQLKTKQHSGSERYLINDKYIPQNLIQVENQKKKSQSVENKNQLIQKKQQQNNQPINITLNCENNTTSYSLTNKNDKLRSNTALFVIDIDQQNNKNINISKSKKLQQNSSVKNLIQLENDENKNQWKKNHKNDVSIDLSDRYAFNNKYNNENQNKYKNKSANRNENDNYNYTKPKNKKMSSIKDILNIHDKNQTKKQQQKVAQIDLFKINNLFTNKNNSSVNIQINNN